MGTVEHVMLVFSEGEGEAVLEELELKYLLSEEEQEIADEQTEGTFQRDATRSGLRLTGTSGSFPSGRTPTTPQAEIGQPGRHERSRWSGVVQAPSTHRQIAVPIASSRVEAWRTQARRARSDTVVVTRLRQDDWEEDERERE